MGKSKTKILVIVEGKKTDIRVMQHLLDIYRISDRHQLVSYNTNIYQLYEKMFSDGEPRDYDILQVLKEHEKDPKIKKIFDENYSDILLVFDMDPQEPRFTAEKIREMTSYFTESSDMGKLYINYPMIEAFYHMRSIPDDEYYSRTVYAGELISHEYKERVRRETIGNDYKKFAAKRSEMNVVIRQNIKKAALITGNAVTDENKIAASEDILGAQLEAYEKYGYLYVLCTCIFYIADYNVRLLEDAV